MGYESWKYEWDMIGKTPVSQFPGLCYNNWTSKKNSVQEIQKTVAFQLVLLIFQQRNLIFQIYTQPKN